MAQEGHTDYFLRSVEDSLWRQVKARAALEGKDMREVIIEALREYVSEGMEEKKPKKGKQ